MGGWRGRPRAGAGGGILALLAVLLGGCTQHVIRVSEVRTLAYRPRASDPAVTVPYLLYRPKGYDDPARAGERWPLVVYLRGWPVMGMEMGDIANGGLPGEVEAGRDFPFLMVAPQAPSLWQGFEPARVHAVVDEAERTLRVDPDRIYLTGLSRGARDAWCAAAARPERFAALLLCCGYGAGRDAARCASIPAWGFHGALDFVVPALLGEGAIAAHRAAGGRSRFTLLGHESHFVWYSVYARTDVYEWMLAQRRGLAPEAAPGPADAAGAVSPGAPRAP